MTHTWTRWNGEMIRISYSGMVNTRIIFARLLQTIGGNVYQVDYYNPDEEGTHAMGFQPFSLVPFK